MTETDHAPAPAQAGVPRQLADDRPRYRAEAVAALESSERLDELLPVTKLRIWMLALAGALLVAGSLAYAAVTPRDVTVSGDGRVVGLNGVRLVTSSAEGELGSFLLPNNAHVEVGQVVGYVMARGARIPQRSQVAGTLLGYISRPGDPIDVGEWLAQVATKIDDGRTALMTVMPEDASKLQEGQPVTVNVLGGPVVTGHVGGVQSGVLGADWVQEGLGMLVPPDGPRVVVQLVLDQPAPPGYEFSATVQVSRRTLLGQLLGMS